MSIDYQKFALPKPLPKKKTSKSCWKNAERRVAKIVGGQRVPMSGAIKTLERGDVWHKKLFIEVKLRARWSFHRIMEKAIEQANDTKPSKIPLLFTIEKGKRDRDFMVTMREEDFERLCREAGIPMGELKKLEG